MTDKHMPNDQRYDELGRCICCEGAGREIAAFLSENKRLREALKEYVAENEELKVACKGLLMMDSFSGEELSKEQCHRIHQHARAALEATEVDK